MSRRRILFLTPAPLDRPRSGGTIKSAALLAHLERDHDVDVACLSGETWARERGEVVSVPIAKPRSATRLLASYLARVPLSVERNRTPALAAAVANLLVRGRHDVAFVDGWLMAQYVPASFAGLRLLHQHNVEHEMWERHAPLERDAVRRAFVRLEASRVRAYEGALLPAFDVVFAVSDADRRAFVDLGGGPERVRVLPNVADPVLLERPALEPPHDAVVLFLGTLSWPPNVAGLERFLRRGFRSLPDRVPGVRLIVAGHGATGRLRALVRSTSDAELLEGVDDDEALYRRARCFVDASVGGAGTRVKILNALARGVPVVATADAASGLQTHTGVHLLEAGDPESMAEPIARVLEDDALWSRLSAEGRRLVRERYSPPGAFGALDEVLATSS
ncbi:MAG TPA: glycosyltransferase family 4 protein [Actinomycetota bacterium]